MTITHEWPNLKKTGLTGLVSGLGENLGLFSESKLFYMQKTLFRPEFDGVSLDEQIKAGPVSIAYIQYVFRHFLRKAIGRLKNKYDIAVDLNHLDEYLMFQLYKHSPESTMFRYGLTYLMLDYFNSYHHMGIIFKKKNLKKLNAIIQERTFTLFKGHAALLLYLKALIDTTIDLDLLKNYILDEISLTVKRFGELESAEVSLGIYPDQNLITAENNFEQWNSLQIHLDKGDPWPIILIDALGNPFDYTPLIAYSYESRQNGKCDVSVLDPIYPDQESLLKIVFDENSRIFEIHYNGHPLAALVTLDYQFLKPKIGIYQRIKYGNPISKWVWQRNRKKYIKAGNNEN